jgi:hypothetical protein
MPMMTDLTHALTEALPAIDRHLVVRMKQMVPVRFEDFHRFPFIPRVPSVAF